MPTYIVRRIARYPRHPGTCAASELPIGTLLGPPLGAALLAFPVPRARVAAMPIGRDAAFSEPLVEPLSDALDEPPEIFARFAFSFSGARGRVDPPAALPLSFTCAGAERIVRAGGSVAFRFAPAGFGGSSSDTPSSSARLRTGGGGCGAGAGTVAGVGETSGAPLLLPLVSPSSGLLGEFASMRIRLSGLGLTGEYAWIMRAARGFAIGKGRARGVFGAAVGAGAVGAASIDGGVTTSRRDLPSIGSSSGVRRTGFGISNAGRGGRGSGAGLDGSDACGEGGGSTNACESDGGCGCGTAMLVLNAGGCRAGDGGRMTSVSKAGVTLCFPFGDTGPSATAKPDDRRETRVFLLLPALIFRGDLRGECRGIDGRADGPATGIV